MAAEVAAPPYDVLDSDEARAMVQGNPRSFLRVSKPEVDLDPSIDLHDPRVFRKARENFEAFVRDGILVQDPQACMYLYRLKMGDHVQTGLYACVSTADYENGTIKKHEHTRPDKEEDRLAHIHALNAQTGPVFLMFRDRDAAAVRALFEQAAAKKPEYRFVHQYDVEHTFWVVKDEAWIRSVQAAFNAAGPLYIADGHHRYESALNYQRERRNASPSSNKEEPYDFVMMTMIDMADPGLVILPAHRLVGGLSAAAIEGLAAKLPSFFNIKETRLDKANLDKQISSLLADNMHGQTLILCVLKKYTLMSLTLKDPESVRSMFPAFHSDIYQKLDVSIVDHVILEELLGITQEQMGSFLNWVHEPALAVEKVLKGECQLSIIVNPVKPGAIKAIADVSDRMPKKSTYFYPKVPAGLVSYRF